MNEKQPTPIKDTSPPPLEWGVTVPSENKKDNNNSGLGVIRLGEPKVDKSSEKIKREGRAMNIAVGSFAAAMVLGWSVTGVYAMDTIDRENTADNLSAEFADGAGLILEEESTTVEYQDNDDLGATWTVSDASGVRFELAVDKPSHEIDVFAPDSEGAMIEASYSLSRALDLESDIELDDALSILKDDKNVVDVEFHDADGGKSRISVEDVDASYQKLNNQ